MKKLSEYPLGHVGFVVRDVDETVKRFGEILGITDFRTYIFEPSHAWSYGKELSHYKLKIAMAAMPDFQTKIEIIQPISEEGIHGEFIKSGRSGIHHIAYTVENFDEWKAYFTENGANIVFESETEDDVIGYRRCFYANDEIMGTVFEVLEKPHFRR